MAATPSLKVIKTFTYRGQTRTFSNRYHLTAGPPADNAHWTTLSDAVVTAEKAIYTSAVTITQTYGYAAGSEVPVFSKAYSTAGTIALSGFRPPGDCASLVRYATTARSSKNHPIYLMNYYHDPQTTSSAVPDTLHGTYSAALGTYAGLWDSTGFSDGTLTYKRAGPNGASATGHIVETYVTHRDLRR